jgi:hypothetical protein
VAASKSSGSKRPPHARRSTIDVDITWADQLPEEEKPANKHAKNARKGPPPLPRQSTLPSNVTRVPRRDTIEVDSRWIVPPLPSEAHGKAQDKVAQPRKSPPPLPAPLVAKPRGKLPPPLPREDDESADEESPKATKRSPSTSKRPPRAGA